MLNPMVGYSINNRNRYKCDYCNHPTYKTIAGIFEHLKTNHKDRWDLDQANAEIKRLKNLPPKEKVVYRDRPVDKEPQKKYWDTGVYCSACKIAYRNVGIPFGQTIEDTPHSNCGTRSLMLVNEVLA